MRFCPICGSSELNYAVPGTTSQIYSCKRCGYRGSVIVEDGLLAEKLENKFEKKSNKG